MITCLQCLGDQQAALVGQRCFKEGDAKNTYGTGCFLLYNTGQVWVCLTGCGQLLFLQQPVKSNHGLLTTVAYKMGPDEPVHYALEVKSMHPFFVGIYPFILSSIQGSVAIAGQCVRWLRDNLLFFSESSEIGQLVNRRSSHLQPHPLEGLARQVEDTAGVYFVPAFSGLFAPYWQHDARGWVWYCMVLTPPTSLV